MPQVKPNTTIKQYQQFTRDVYGLNNDRYFSVQDMLANVERFMTRALKGIRKNDNEKIKLNLIISSSWFISMMNQLHIDIEEEIWKRFPYACSYCASCPCVCKEQKIQIRQKIVTVNEKRPKTMQDFQDMFNEIYPASDRTLDHAGVHLVEEMGEIAEAILNYRGNHNDEDFKNIILESADLMSCIMGVFNSLKISLAKELSIIFNNNCHVCKKAPCVCSFTGIIGFKS
ncbi:MAG: MazG-like family protein [Candidatus Staskawiczbacteria bacterium]|nr:MazG-like family protein [Candidatus Staskawiczbacteria bacterium]